MWCWGLRLSGLRSLKLFLLLMQYHPTKPWFGWSSFLLVLSFLCPQRPKLNSRHQRASAFKHWHRPPPTNICTYTWTVTCLPFEKHTFPTYSMSCSRQQVGLPTVCSCHRKVTFPYLLWWETKWGILTNLPHSPGATPPLLESRYWKP